MGSVEIVLRSLPYLDGKWLRADLNSALQNSEDLAILWNNLVKDHELVSPTNQYPLTPACLNSAGNLSYMSVYSNKHYCGVDKLTCVCCTGYCRPSSNCNCTACSQLDIEDNGKKVTSPSCGGSTLNQQNVSSDSLLDSWLWGPTPTSEQKSNCLKSLLTEQRDLALQAAGHSLSAIHLKQRLFIYQRYFMALERCKPFIKNNHYINNQRKYQKTDYPTNVIQQPSNASLNSEHRLYKNQSNDSILNAKDTAERATLGLARVGTRAALNFSFAFLRRAWRSGEDTELCSELLLEALDALQGLPEASLFDFTQMSGLWIEVLERSIKFLRQVVLGDCSGTACSVGSTNTTSSTSNIGRCIIPRTDRNTALLLLMELGSQKGTLGASLEAVLLLLTLWEFEKEREKEKDELNDNRLPVTHSIGAPLVSILRRYEKISNEEKLTCKTNSDNYRSHTSRVTRISSATSASLTASSTNILPPTASPTESFLRFLTLPEQDSANVDLKQAAVVIISHLDRLTKPHLPIGNYTTKIMNNNQQEPIPQPEHQQQSHLNFQQQNHQQTQQIFTLGSLSISSENYGFTAEPSIIGSGGGVTDFGYQFNSNNQQQYKQFFSSTLTFDNSNVTIKQIVFSEKQIYLLSQNGNVYLFNTELTMSSSPSSLQPSAPPQPPPPPQPQPPVLPSLSSQPPVVVPSTSAAIVVPEAIAASPISTSTTTLISGFNGSESNQLIKCNEFNGLTIIKLAAHCEGRHFLALDSEQHVFSWGIGEGGRLGHGDTLPKETPTKIQSLNDKFITNIFCGSAYSAALTISGELYTWGRGQYGSLGHGLSDDKLQPCQVKALIGHTIVDVALGSGDAHTLCCTDNGLLFVWGDGEYGKLGDGLCTGSHIPIQIETIGMVSRVFNGSHFSLALTFDGILYSWGKCYGGCLGHGEPSQENNNKFSGIANIKQQSSNYFTKNMEYCNVPKRIQDLSGKHIVDVSVGATHCLALTNNGELYGWGRNEFHQICSPDICRDPIILKPRLITPPSLKISGVSCGATQSILWCYSSMVGIPTRIPFVVDLTETTFRFIDQLLGMVSSSINNNNILNIGSTPQQQQQQQSSTIHTTQQQQSVGSDVRLPPPNQESECIAVACLNLLRLQLHAVLSNNISPKTIGLSENSKLLTNLKMKILNLAGGSHVLKTIQDAAQWTLQIGWSILLPTAAERAQTLTSLLPSEPLQSTSGHRFMTDLLVGSLMAEEGLETALKQAINSEPIDDECLTTTNYEHNLPLLHLIKQVLRNNSALTQARLNQLLAGSRCTNNATTNSYMKMYSDDHYLLSSKPPSSGLDLLHRFQRLLLSYIYQSKNNDDLLGAEALLSKYIHYIVQLCITTVTKAYEVSLQGKDGVTEILNSDISNTLIYELLIGLVLLHRDKQSLLLMNFDWTKCFLPLLNILDKFNRSMDDAETQDSDDMGWPAIINRSGGNQSGHIITTTTATTITTTTYQQNMLNNNSNNRANYEKQDEIQNLIRKNDFENNVLDGGKWIILNGYVYDIEYYQCDNGTMNELLQQGIGKDLTNDFQNNSNNLQFKVAADYILNYLKIGKFDSGDCGVGGGSANIDEKFNLRKSGTFCKYNLTHLNSERTLAYLLGLRSCLLQKSLPLQPAEIQCKNLLKSPIFSGGLQLLQPANPFDEEKGEARSAASTTGSTPTESSNQHVFIASTKHNTNNNNTNNNNDKIPIKMSWPNTLITHRIYSLLNGLAETRLNDPVVSTWLLIVDRYCKENNFICHQDFPIDHPITELERLLTAVFIHHQSLGPLILAVIDRELSADNHLQQQPQQQHQQQQPTLPKSVSNIISLVHQTKWTLIKTRQQLNRSYKEVCAPMLEKCRFLLYEIRSAISIEQIGLKRLNILYKRSRFKDIVHRLIREIRTIKIQQRQQNNLCQKFEDLLNVTIQQQQQQLQQNSTAPILNQHQKVSSTENLLSKTNSFENLNQQQRSATPPSFRTNSPIPIIIATNGCVTPSATMLPPTSLPFSLNNQDDIKNIGQSNDNLTISHNGSGDSNIISDKKLPEFINDSGKTPINDQIIMQQGSDDLVKKQFCQKKSLYGDDDDLFINNVIEKLNEKYFQQLAISAITIGELNETVCSGKDSSNVNVGHQYYTKIMSMICDFILQDSCDVETLRRAMYCQAQRYKIRKQGIEMFIELLGLDKRKQQQQQQQQSFIRSTIESNDPVNLLDSVQYNLLNGYLGLFLDKSKQHYQENVLDNLNMITAYQKCNLILIHSKIIDWSIDKLKKIINQEQISSTISTSATTAVPTTMRNSSTKFNINNLSSTTIQKDNSNLGTYGFLKKLPRARFLLSVFGILAKDMGANEMSLIINSGALGSILGLLRQTGGTDITTSTHFNNISSSINNKYTGHSEVAFVYDDTVIRQKHKYSLTGPELAKLMTLGTRVVRGKDWKWAEQDGPKPGEGKIVAELGDDGWIRVEWDNGCINSYRMGKDDQFDLYLAGCAPTIGSPAETETEDDISLIEIHLNGNSHPTKLLKNACIKILKIISVSIGQHGDKMDKQSIKSIASMFHTILSSKIGFLNLTLEHWTTLGFLRAISTSKLLSKYLTTPLWINLYTDIINSEITCEQDMYKKVQCLRLLQATLINWDETDCTVAPLPTTTSSSLGNNLRVSDLVQKLFSALGKFSTYCPNDISLIQNPIDRKSRVLATCSNSSTVSEELITLLRKLHVLPLWNSCINSYLSEKLCIAADLFADGSITNVTSPNGVNGAIGGPVATTAAAAVATGLNITNIDSNDNIELEKSLVCSALNVIGGYDIRPRIGINLSYERQRGTITNFTRNARIILNIHHSIDTKKIPMYNIVKECYENAVFSLSKLPLNEMLLNSLTILMYGPGLWKSTVPNIIDVQLLRSQQLHLASMNAMCVLFRHQNSLRKILRQRSPGFSRYNSDENLNPVPDTVHHETVQQRKQSMDKTSSKYLTSQMMDTEQIKQQQQSPSQQQQSDQQDDQKQHNENELLLQSLLIRATQPNPLKPRFTYSEIAMAALNITQILASNIYTANNAPFSIMSQHLPPPVQPTLIHGVPVYNDPIFDELQTPSSEGSNFCTGRVGTSNATVQPKKLPPSPLISQIMEIGFSRKIIELAIRILSTHLNVTPTAEQIVQWLLEQGDTNQVTSSVQSVSSRISVTTTTTTINSNIITTTTSSTSLQRPLTHHPNDVFGDIDTDSESTDTVEGSSFNDTSTRYALRDDFLSPDDYAVYVRALVIPGMTVRCCCDFEEIMVGDIGTVLKVDTEALHDLNVKVDWQMHGEPFWMCFTHIELLEPPKDHSSNDPTSYIITVGSHVRIKSNVSTPRYKWGSVGKGSVGVVTKINGDDVTVDFPRQYNWTGQLNEMELVCQGNLAATSNTGTAGQNINLNDAQSEGELIEDWSRCIRSLCVSSNESLAKHLLDKTANFWQSGTNVTQKHWIRLEIHENILIHQLGITTNPADNSFMPQLIVVRVGDTISTLKDYSWVCVRPTDIHVQLLSDIRQYYKWIEILVKGCRNNGIQCKIHNLNIIGRRKQTDLEIMLMNAKFLANEFDSICEPISTTSCSSTYYEERLNEQNQCKVLVWGLNDKEQLGGLKGSKVKIPTLSSTLSQLRPIHIAGGSKSLFIVSQDGKVYACGEGTNGRLGLGHNYNIQVPRLVPILSQYVVKKVAVHSGGKHAMAITLDGKVFSWGEGEDGKLGHGNRLTLDKPKLIESLRSKRIRDIACGSSHSAAVTSSGELYTWGLGEYGRLGHGDNCTQLKPKLVQALSGHRIVQIACGSRDAQTLALTEDGLVFSWGDGDFGKLGRGGSEGCATPHQIERLNGVGVIQIECGAQFSLALTKVGEVWTWGKGDYYRLGHGSDQHVRKPTPIQGLRGKKVIHVAVGALHCLAVTDAGQVYAWGDNDHGQQGSGNTQVNKKPIAVIGLDNLFVNRVACGSSHSIAWSLPQCAREYDKEEPVAFTTNKDPLGGNSLGIYDSEPHPQQTTLTGLKPLNNDKEKKSLSEILLSLESYGARQTALNYVLNAMSILQARHCIIAALTSHSQMGLHTEKFGDSDEHFKELESMQNAAVPPVQNSQQQLNQQQEQLEAEQKYTQASHHLQINSDMISVQGGGGEGPADPSILTAIQENGNAMTPDSADEILPAGLMPMSMQSSIVQQNGSLSAFQSLTGSLSLSASISVAGNNITQRPSKMSASAMSVMAATLTHQDVGNDNCISSGLDEFTTLLGESEAKTLIELLKLSVAGRTGHSNTAQTIANTLIALGMNSNAIGAMILETCITELEDLCTSRHFLGKLPNPVLQETSHPYIDDVTLEGHVRIPGAESLRLEFDRECATEKRNDPLVIMDGTGRVVATRSGRELELWKPSINIAGEEMRWKFTSDSSLNGWGWRFWVHAVMPPFILQETGSDRAILSQPSMDLVMALLDSRLEPQNINVLLRLAAAVAACAQLSCLTTVQRIWSLKKLHSLLMSKDAPKPLDPSLTVFLTPLIPALLRQYEYEESQVRGGVHLMNSEYLKTLLLLACDMQLDSMLPQSDMHKWAWFRRYCTAVRVAQSLINRTSLPRSFCMEVRKKLSEMLPNIPLSLLQQQQPTQQHLNNLPASTSSSYTSIQSAGVLSSTGAIGGSCSGASGSSIGCFAPSSSSLNTQSLSSQMNLLSTSLGTSTASLDASNNMTTDTEQLLTQLENTHSLHEDNCVFTAEHDRQLLQWLNRRPEDWALSWGGASTIYGWGHNHRGQLGGLEGGRIKSPTPCEALSLLRPIQLAGGEQTLYAVTPDGKLFSTGYGAGGRLGIGGTDSVSTPILVESLQVFIKKVAVNSGGKHCLALSAEGEVYSWGEGEDGKLGHGNRANYDRPKLIEALSGIGVIDIACGSSHSACITSGGHVLTWGKGRYGRLGHGDSEDQTRPKLVEALAKHRAIDIACGSGDAQTLCITDDDNVWSWGDGDYGKLGRGGSEGCKTPYKIDSLAGLGVVKVECGSQFSVALTRSGAVYTWGKGDYHRLGHGSVDHVRRPKKVTALQGKKIISIATGSLHCVACSDTGEVFTWGDNDEGQLGDGTVSAIQRPRLVQGLQKKHIIKVTCGSAHTVALSTSQMSESVRPLPNPPLEYDFVRDLPPETLHARLVLLHHFTELLCPCLSMLPITGPLSLGALKDTLVYSIKEASFRKVIQTTMVREKQHGPIIELNRIQVKRSRNRYGGGLAGQDGMKSVFGQMVQKLPLLTQEALYLPHRVWKVKFVGESVDDCGGGFSESIAEMCDELQNGSVPLLIQTPNGRGEAGANRDCFLLDPTLNSVLQMNMFRFLGVLMGIAVRTGSPLSLNLAEPVWRQLAGESLRPTDLTEVDRDYIASLLYIRDMEDDPKNFQTLELPFSTPSAKGHEVPLSTKYTRVTAQNKHEFVRLALNYRLHEFDEQVKAVRDGMSKVIPVPLLSLFSASQLQALVCGSPEIPLDLLKSVATYKGVESTSALVQWFWEVMEEFSNHERSLFLRFVWGRTRLPRTIADFRGRDFVLQVLDKYSPADHFLPESYTCFFLLKMPRYSCKPVLVEKLKYAIYFCKSIDTDEYARVNMAEATEPTLSENNSDIESEVSEEI